LIFSDGHDIANPQIPTGFTTLTIDMHLTAIHRIGSQITGFKKPSSPKPFINTNIFSVSHTSVLIVNRDWRYCLGKWWKRQTLKIVFKILFQQSMLAKFSMFLNIETKPII
jgi:hypothetical protein